MSEKEQLEAIRLLGELLKFARAGKVPPPDVVAKAERFLKLESPTPEPQSHGQRRS